MVLDDVQVGIPDYYHKDLLYQELERYLYDIHDKAEELDVTPQFYVMEFLD